MNEGTVNDDEGGGWSSPTLGSKLVGGGALSCQCELRAASAVVGSIGSLFGGHHH